MNKTTVCLLSILTLAAQGCSRYVKTESTQGLQSTVTIINWLDKKCILEITHNPSNKRSLFIKDRTTDASAGQMLKIKFRDRNQNTTQWINITPNEDAVLSNSATQFGRVLLNYSGTTIEKRSLTACFDTQRLSYISQSLGINLNADLHYKIAVNAYLDGIETTFLETEWLKW